jgi:hypothetical protein
MLRAVALRSTEDDGRGPGDEALSAALRRRAERLRAVLVGEHDDRRETSMNGRVPITEEQAP